MTCTARIFSLPEKFSALGSTVQEIYLSLTNHPGQLSLAIPPWVGK